MLDKERFFNIYDKRLSRIVARSKVHSTGKFGIPKKVAERFGFPEWKVMYVNIFNTVNSKVRCKRVGNLFILPENRRTVWGEIRWMRNRKGGMFMRIHYRELPEHYNPFHFELVLSDGTVVDSCQL